MLYPKYKGLEPECRFIDLLWHCVDDRGAGVGHTPDHAKAHWRCAYYQRIHGDAQENLRELANTLKREKIK